MYQQVLDFWFDETNSAKWFVKDPEFDKELIKRFKDLVLSAAAGECYSWRTNAYGRLAEIIVLDQMSRNIFRDTPAAFAQDAMALTLAQEIADRKSTRLNSSHVRISYAVFCLKKKKLDDEEAAGVVRVAQYGVA